MTTIKWSPEAAGELDAVLDYFIERNPAAASNLAARILDAVDSVAARQFTGPAVTLLTGERVQSWPVPPVRLYYHWEGEILVILRLHDQRRAPIAK